MGTYILRRLLLLPITLFFIVLVNFLILNLAPGDPVTQTDVGAAGASRREDQAQSFGTDERYLQFREFYGLTLPIIFNTWPWTSLESVETTLWQVVNKRYTPNDTEEIPFKTYQDIKTTMGDKSRFVMPHLLTIMNDPNQPFDVRKAAARFFIRGGTQQGYFGPTLTADQKNYNRKIGQENYTILKLMPQINDSEADILEKIKQLSEWYPTVAKDYQFEPTTSEKVYDLFFKTRFSRYLGRVLTLDFGTMRNDSNKLVIDEVSKRFKYSLTLSILPMIATFFLCQILGFIMALYQNRWPDYLVNIACLVLYAIPVFVVAPFLIEKVALYHNFPFTSIPIPISGFTSSEEVYSKLTTWQRVGDVMQHIALPLLAILYGGLAAQARLSRTAVLEVLRQDYVRTAYAKGLPTGQVLVKHVGRNAAITIVTSIAGSLGIILGGSLIVETLFQIDGYGKFFYDAIINRDYNVIMFSALAGSFLTLMGYLVADLSYAALDPRLRLD